MFVQLIWQTKIPRLHILQKQDKLLNSLNKHCSFSLKSDFFQFLFNEASYTAGFLLILFSKSNAKFEQTVMVLNDGDIIEVKPRPLTNQNTI